MDEKLMIVQTNMWYHLVDEKITLFVFNNRDMANLIIYVLQNMNIFSI